MSYLLLWCHLMHRKTTSIRNLVCNILTIFLMFHVELSTRIRPVGISPSPLPLTMLRSLSQPTVCLKLIVSPFTVSFASSPWGYPLNRGPITPPLESRPFSLMQLNLRFPLVKATLNKQNSLQVLSLKYTVNYTCQLKSGMSSFGRDGDRNWILVISVCTNRCW